MHAQIDDNRLLVSSDVLDTNKEFQQTVQGYTIASHDKQVLAIHKKQCKEIHFKDLGEKMQLIYISKRSKALSETIKTIDTAGALAGLSFFRGMDDDGNPYNYLYKYPHTQVNVLQTQLGLLGLPVKVSVVDESYVDVSYTHDNTLQYDSNNFGPLVSFLYILGLLYGRLQIKQDCLFSATIHMPLFGAYLKEQNLFDTIIYFLQQHGIFVEKHIEESSDGIVYQISIRDYELLSCFASYHKHIANITKIATLQKRDYYIDLVNGFLENEGYSLDDDTRSQREKHVVKFLEK